MDNPPREDLIHHQQMEQNYDSAHEMLEEPKSDIANLQDIEDHMENMHDQIQALCDNIQQGYFDLGTFELCVLWFNLIRVEIRELRPEVIAEDCVYWFTTEGRTNE